MFPSLELTIILVSPSDTPVTIPFESTFAIPSFSDLYDIFLLLASSGTTFAIISYVSFTCNTIFSVPTTKSVTGLYTLIFILLLTPLFAFAVIVALPGTYSQNISITIYCCNFCITRRIF